MSMPISSLVLRTIKSKIPSIIESLKLYSAVGLVDVEQNNIFVITKTNNSLEDEALWEDIKNLPGVIRCELIYHHIEKTEGE